jgi:hypothetical protein
MSLQAEESLLESWKNIHTAVTVKNKLGGDIVSCSAA